MRRRAANRRYGRIRRGEIGREVVVGTARRQKKFRILVPITLGSLEQSSVAQISRVLEIAVDLLNRSHCLEAVAVVGLDLADAVLDGAADGLHPRDPLLQHLVGHGEEV